MDTHHFIVSELLPDNRVIVTSYTRIDDWITCTMDVFDTPELRERKRVLDVNLMNGNKSISSGINPFDTLP